MFFTNLFTYLVLGSGRVPLLQAVQVDVSGVTFALTRRHLPQKGRGNPFDSDNII